MKRPLSLGFENENELNVNSFATKYPLHSPVSIYRNALNQYGDVHSDATIDYGFEFASSPVDSREFEGEAVKSAKWTNFFNLINGVHPVESRDNVGMHGHIGKAGISAVETLKMNYFVFRNQDFCELIGERKATAYCLGVENPLPYVKVAPVRPLPITNPRLQPWGRHGLAYNVGITGASDSMKYKMLNVARPGTIEFRFFKAVTNVRALFKNMQFMIALVHFVRTSPIAILDYKIGGQYVCDIYGEKVPCGKNDIVKKFLAFVEFHKKAYAELYAFLVEKGRIAPPKAAQKPRARRKAIARAKAKGIPYGGKLVKPKAKKKAKKAKKKVARRSR